MMRETFDSINEWQRKTFPAATKDGVFNHICEEWAEFNEAKNETEKIEEASDLVILLLAYIDRITSAGAQIAIDRKMFINRARWWRIQEDGTGRHV